MNRRTALMLSILGGGLLPARLWAQQSGSRKGSKTGDKKLQPVTSREDEPEQTTPNDEPAAPLSPEPGFEWRRYPITRYTKVVNSLSTQTNPQKAIIDWIFKRTGISEWHGDKVAVLSASRTELAPTIRPKS